MIDLKHEMSKLCIYEIDSFIRRKIYGENWMYTILDEEKNKLDKFEIEDSFNISSNTSNPLWFEYLINLLRNQLLLYHREIRDRDWNF